MIAASRLLVMLLIGIAPAQAAEPGLVRARLDPAGEIWVGQRVLIDLQILAQGTFASAPTFDLPQVPGILLIPPSTSPVLSTESVEGVSYTSQLHRIAVFAQRPGEVVIPPIGARFAAAMSPGTPPIDVSLTSGPLSFQARMPPGAEALGTVISSAKLTLEESWQPVPAATARVGDAFTRRVRLSAPDVPGLAFPPLPEAAVPGVGVYPRAPEVNDRSERGRFSGERSEETTYVLERPGAVTLPGLALTWWNLDRRQLVTSRLPERSLEVAAVSAAPASAPEPAWQPLRSALRIAAVLGIGLAAALLYRLAPDRSRLPEPAAYARLCAACRRSEPRAVYAALLAWLATLGRTPDGQLGHELRLLERTLYAPAGPEPAWSPKRLLAHASELRRSLRHPGRVPATRSPLATLNPGAPEP